jgi:hypothetical protein
VAHTATLVRSYGPPGFFTFFMGSAQYLPSTGHTMIGWAASTQALATEVKPDPTPQDPTAMSPVWQLTAARSPDDHTYISYRSLKDDAPDATKPVVTVERPLNDQTYSYGERVAVRFSCTDTGGSTLQTCGSQLPGSLLTTTSPHVSTFTVTATDGAGNTTSVVRHFSVFRPDVSVRTSGGTYLGAGQFRPASPQVTSRKVSPGTAVTVPFRLTSLGNNDDRCLVQGSSGTKAFAATYRSGGADVTDRVVAGTWRTPVIPPGSRQVLSLRVAVGANAVSGRGRTFTVRCGSTHAAVADAAGLRLTVR